MFNNSNGYSLADIAAATGSNNRNDGITAHYPLPLLLQRRYVG